jgi:hypothetical protein
MAQPDHPYAATFVRGIETQTEHRCPNLLAIVQDAVVTPIAQRVIAGMRVQSLSLPKPFVPFISSIWHLKLLYDPSLMASRPGLESVFDPEIMARQISTDQNEATVRDDRRVNVRSEHWSGKALCVDGVVWRDIGSPMCDMLEHHLTERYLYTGASRYFPSGPQTMAGEYGPDMWTAAGDVSIKTTIGSSRKIDGRASQSPSKDRDVQLKNIPFERDFPLLREQIVAEVTRRYAESPRYGGVTLYEFQRKLSSYGDEERLWEYILGHCFSQPGLYVTPLQRILVAPADLDEPKEHGMLEHEDFVSLAQHALAFSVKSIKRKTPLRLDVRSGSMSQWFASVYEPSPYNPHRVAMPSRLMSAYAERIFENLCRQMPYPQVGDAAHQPGMPYRSRDEISWRSPESF